MIKSAPIRVDKARKQQGRVVSEGGMNLKTTDINQLINNRGQVAGGEEMRRKRWKVEGQS